MPKSSSKLDLEKRSWREVVLNYCRNGDKNDLKIINACFESDGGSASFFKSAKERLDVEFKFANQEKALSLKEVIVAESKDVKTAQLLATLCNRFEAQFNLSEITRDVTRNLQNKNLKASLKRAEVATKFLQDVNRYNSRQISPTTSVQKNQPQEDITEESKAKKGIWARFVDYLGSKFRRSRKVDIASGEDLVSGVGEDEPDSPKEDKRNKSLVLPFDANHKDLKEAERLAQEVKAEAGRAATQAKKAFKASQMLARGFRGSALERAEAEEELETISLGSDSSEPSPVVERKKGLPPVRGGGRLSGPTNIKIRENNL